MLRELLETEHELVHTRYRISHENRGTIGQTVYVFSDFILLDSDLCESECGQYGSSVSRTCVHFVPIESVCGLQIRVITGRR